VDTLRALEHLSNVLTVDEWQEFKRTDDYLWMVSRVNGYRGSSMDELVRRGMKRREEAWQIANEMAESIVSSDLADVAINVPEEGKRMVVRKLAEKLLVEQDVIPLTYTAWADCDVCGRVPVPEGSEEVVSNCPWCLK
jgi:hypothetical protein